MRIVMADQLNLGEVAISDIEFDSRCRDELPQLLMGIQSLHCDTTIRVKIFKILEELVPKNINPTLGRKGITLWEIFVLGLTRLCCNINFDRLHDEANNHIKLRQMLGHSSWGIQKQYALQTLKDNLALFTPEILEKLNQVIVEHGHNVFNIKSDDILKGSCDSFVNKTNVHFPTDISVLWDAIRKIITLTMQVCDKFDISSSKQGKSNIRKVKRYFRAAQQSKRSTSKNPEVKAKKDQLVVNAHTAYVNLARQYVNMAQKTLKDISNPDLVTFGKICQIEEYIGDAELLIDQIHRRVVEGQSIPHHEKIFSIFEKHTEWISKGKAGVPVELGLRVCIVKDQYGFILHHRVMENETDEKIAVAVIRATQKLFPDFKSCSFDKGFHSKSNQEELSELLDELTLPRKGKLSKAAEKIEQSEAFIEARRKHSAVESSINALGNHGLDRCPDRGLHGFKRYTALAIVARNIQIIGSALQKKELKQLQRQSKKTQLAA